MTRLVTPSFCGTLGTMSISMLKCISFSLLRSQISNHPSTFDSEEDVVEVVDGGMSSFNHAHMRKAFRLMNDLRR